MVCDEPDEGYRAESRTGRNSCNIADGRTDVTELADHIHITPPSVNVAVQKLEKLGYIRKEQDEKDQRMTRIHLTERGEKILGNMHEILRSTEDTLLKNMSTEEKILCRRLLLQMSDNLFQEKEFRDMPCKNPFEE